MEARSPNSPRPSLLSLSAMAGALASGYLFGRWYMRTGWDLGWRTSQFFFNWQDLGFVKRGLIGTLLHPFPSLQRNEVFFATSWLLVIALTAAFVSLFRRAAERLEPAAARRLLVVCVASPAVFMRQGFDLGRFDPLGLVALARYFAGHPRFSPLLLSSIACDHYRWVALAATNMFFAMLLQVPRLASAGASPRIPSGPLAWLLVATAALGPISNTKSFPLPFLLLDRLCPGVIEW